MALVGGYLLHRWSVKGTEALSPFAEEVQPLRTLDAQSGVRDARARILSDQERGEEVVSAGKAFLREYWGERWDEVYAHYLGRGGDPDFIDRIDPDELPDWNAVQDGVIGLVMAAIDSADFPLVPRVLAWADQEVRQPFQEGFSVDGEPVPSDLFSSLESALAPYDENLRALSEELSLGMRRAIATEVLFGTSMTRSPFISATPRQAPANLLLSTSLSHEGWCVSLQISADAYPEIADIQRRITETRNARAVELRRALRER